MGRYSLDTFDMGMGKPLPRERWPLTLLELLWLSAVAGFAYEPWGPLGVVAASCFFVHYFFDGAWRWQLYVLYGATVAVLPSLWFSNLLEDYRVEAQSIAVAAVCLTLVFAVAVPRVTLPGPTGPCRDITRHSCVVDSPTDGVVFTLTAYVPTKLDLRDASPAAYLRKGTAATAGMALLAKIPAQLLTTVAATGSRLFTEDWALPDPRAFFLTRPADTPKASESKLPVVVFSHGLGGVPDVYQSIISEVCSHVSDARWCRAHVATRTLLRVHRPAASAARPLSPLASPRRTRIAGFHRPGRRAQRWLCWPFGSASPLRQPAAV